MGDMWNSGRAVVLGDDRMEDCGNNYRIVDYYKES